MKNASSIDEILLYAIKSEKETADFYLHLSNIARNSKIRQTFELYARDEFAHISKLTRVRENGPVENISEKLQDFKLSDYTIQIDTSAKRSYSEELVLAMRKLRASSRLFCDLASRAYDQETSKILKILAEEESKQKLGVEIEYNDSLLLCH